MWDDLKRQVLSGELTPSEALRILFVATAQIPFGGLQHRLDNPGATTSQSWTCCNSTNPLRGIATAQSTAVSPERPAR